MLNSKLLCCFVLVPTVFGASTDETGAGGLDEPAGLEGQLALCANFIREQPDNGEYAPVNQKLVELLNLILGRLPEFFKDSETCYRMLEILHNLGSQFRFQEPLPVRDYAHPHQEPLFSACFVRSSRWALGKTSEILQLWCKDNLRSLEALASFLGAGIEAITMQCEVSVCRSGVLRTDYHELFQHGQDDGGNGAGPDRETVAQIVERIEGTKRTIYVNYVALAERATRLFKLMIKEAECILNDLEDSQRRLAYELFKGYLFHCFSKWTDCSPRDLATKDGVFKNNDQRVLSEVHASVLVGIFRELLEFKLKFPELTHNDRTDKLFSYNATVRESSFNDGPDSLIGELMLRELEAIIMRSEPEGIASGILAQSLTFYWLRKWVYSLYQRLSGESMPRGQAERWLGDVEGGLCIALETIESADRRAGLYALGCLIPDLEPTAVVIEKILERLYGTKQLGRREGEPGHFLIKLRQVSEKVLRDTSSVKGNHSTGGPENLVADKDNGVNEADNE